MARQYFHGFEPNEVRSLLKQVLTTPEAAPPEIHKFHDAVAMPGMKGLYDHAGRRIDEAGPATLSPSVTDHRRTKLSSHSPASISLPPTLKVVEEPVLFGGCLVDHYGHFLIDSMSRLWARHEYPRLPILFMKPQSWRDHPAYGREIFGELGLLDRIVTVDEPTVFREVICPGTAFEYRWRVFSVADEPHTAVTRGIGRARRRTWPRPVYLTRSGLSTSLRKSEAEPELEAELSRRGIDIIRVETLPLSDQIGLFEQAPLILGTMGSAFHTSLFPLRSKASLGMLTWARGTENYLLVDAVKQHSSHYLKSMVFDAERRDFVLDVERSLRLLEEAKLIATRPQVGSARVEVAGGN